MATKCAICKKKLEGIDSFDPLCSKCRKMHDSIEYDSDFFG